MAVTMRVFLEYSFVCTVDDEGAEADAEAREAALKPVPSRERTCVPPCLTVTSRQCLCRDWFSRYSRPSPWIFCPPFLTRRCSGELFDVEASWVLRHGVAKEGVIEE